MEVTGEKIIEIIKNSVEANVDFENINFDVPLSDQGLDSLDHLTMFLEIEESYGISIPEKEIERLKSINDIVEYLKNKTN